MVRSKPIAASPSIHPVQVLRQHVTALEAAITVALASPKKEAVHRIRTSTRRIEAQLALLSMLPALPDHARAAHKVLRALGKLRRQAGKVRDLDVQRRLLREAPSQDISSNEIAPTDSLTRRAKTLSRKLKHRRDDVAEQLQHRLKRRSPSISRQLEKLMSKLESAEAAEIPSAELEKLTRAWFRTNMPHADDITSVDDLHSVRKAAKLARYIAESAASGGGQRKGKARGQSVPDLAGEFESMQQSGGNWHDLLMLSAVARHELGKRDPLTRELDQRCEAALQAYREELGHSLA